MDTLCDHNNSQRHANNDMTSMQLEQDKHSGATAPRQRYSIAHLTNIGYQNGASVDISKFETEAIQAGIISGPAVAPESFTMALSEIPPNRERRRHVSARNVNARGSIGHGVVLPGSKATAPHLQPDRQPFNAPAGLDAQKAEGFARPIKHNAPAGIHAQKDEDVAHPIKHNAPTGIHAQRDEDVAHPIKHNAPTGIDAQRERDEGFARFIKEHSSPNHHRVTAGGRIVPMMPNAAPPKFNLLIDNPVRGNNNNIGQQQVAGDQKIGNQRPVDHPKNAGVAKADLTKVDLSNVHPAHNEQTIDSHQTLNTVDGVKPHTNTGPGGLKNGNRKPRPSDLLIHVTHESSKGLPQILTDSTSSFNSHTPPLTELSSSSMVFNPHTNMMVPNRKRHPFMVSALTPDTPFSPVTGADQTNLLATHDEKFGHIQQGLQPGFANNSNVTMPVSSASYNQLSYPVSAPLNFGMTGFAAPQYGSMPQVGTNFQAGPHGPLPTTNMPVNNMTMNHLLTQPANVPTRKVTEKDVFRAKRAFEKVGLDLKGLDMYTAANYPSISQENKSNYAKERMELVEKRDLARRNWLRLYAEFKENSSDQPDQPGPANHQQTSSTTAMTTASMQKNANTNLNVQAADWVPKHANKGNGIHAQPQSSSSNVAKPPIVGHAGIDMVTTGTANPSFAGIMNPPPFIMNQPLGTQLANQPNMPPFIPPTSFGWPGPYTRQMFDPNHAELHDWDVDEWGVRRALAPPDIAQMQHERSLILEAQYRDYMDRLRAAASANPQNFPHMYDEWGGWIGYAPLDIARKQAEQNAKLQQMHPAQRSQITLADLDNMPNPLATLHSNVNPKTNPSKTVKFNEKTAVIPYTGGKNSNGDASSVARVDENESAQNGTKTDGDLANGRDVRNEALGKKLDKGRQNQSVTSEQDRVDNSKQLVSTEKGLRDLEVARKKSGGAGYNLWAFQDQNNPFRHKGPSSVALQSITAIGTGPGFTGIGDREPPKDLKPLPPPGSKVDPSPEKRSFKEIWAAPSTPDRNGDTDEKKDGSGESKEMSKF